MIITLKLLVPKSVKSTNFYSTSSVSYVSSNFDVAVNIDGGVGSHDHVSSARLSVLCQHCRHVPHGFSVLFKSLRVWFGPIFAE